MLPFLAQSLLWLSQKAIFLALLLWFLVQSYQSVEKYREGKTSVSFRQLRPLALTFPSLAVCPTGLPEEPNYDDDSLDWNLAEEYGAVADAEKGLLAIVKSLSHGNT